MIAFTTRASLCKSIILWWPTNLVRSDDDVTENRTFGKVWAHCEAWLSKNTKAMKRFYSQVSTKLLNSSRRRKKYCCGRDCSEDTVSP
jgi:hypothetical protein